MLSFRVLKLNSLPFLLALTSFWLMNCATSKQEKKEDKPNDDFRLGKKGKFDEKKDEDVSIDVSSGYKSFLTTIRNNPLLPYNVNKSSLSRMKSELSKMISRKSDKTSSAVYASLLSANRLSNDGLNTSRKVAEKYVAHIVKSKPQAKLPDPMKLELALVSLSKKNYSYADYFISELVSSKNKSIRSSALTARGIIEMEDGLLPEAVESWKAALKVEPKAMGAHLNWGLLALQYGDFDTAKEHLAMFRDDWFGKYMMITIYKFSGKQNLAYSVCNEALLKKSNFKPLYLNCASVASLNVDTREQALRWLSDYNRQRPVSREFDKRAAELKNRILAEKAAEKAAQQKKDAPKEPVKAPTGPETRKAEPEEPKKE